MGHLLPYTAIPLRNAEAASSHDTLLISPTSFRMTGGPPHALRCHNLRNADDAIAAAQNRKADTHTPSTQPPSAPTSQWTLGDNMASSCFRPCWKDCQSDDRGETKATPFLISRTYSLSDPCWRTVAARVQREASLAKWLSAMLGKMMRYKEGPQAQAQ